MGDIRHMNRATERAAIANVTRTAAGLAIATDTTQPQSANAVDYTIDGLFLSLAASNPLLDLSTAESAADINPDADTAQKALVLLSVDAAGTVYGYQSAVVDATDTIRWPWMPLNHSVIGGLVIETNASTTFTPGTTALSAAGVTTTYVDMAHVPAETR